MGRIDQSTDRAGVSEQNDRIKRNRFQFLIFELHGKRQLLFKFIAYLSFGCENFFRFYFLSILSICVSMVAVAACGKGTFVLFHTFIPFIQSRVLENLCACNEFHSKCNFQSHCMDLVLRDLCLRLFLCCCCYLAGVRFCRCVLTCEHLSFSGVPFKCSLIEYYKRNDLFCVSHSLPLISFLAANADLSS